MSKSRFISQFTISKEEKSTPATHDGGSQHPSKCPYCLDHITKITQCKKKEVILQLQIEKMKEQIDKLNRENQQLINAKILTYHEYHKKIEQQNNSCWNREDLEAQLFEMKTIVQLLIVSKSISSIPQIKLYDFEGLRQKYSDILLQNLRLQQKVMVRDRVIEEKVFFPIYHYDQRVISLRKAMVYWYRKAEEECARMKGRCKDLKLKVNFQLESMHQMLNQELDASKVIVKSILSQKQIQKVKKGEQKEKKIKILKIDNPKSEIKKIR